MRTLIAFAFAFACGALLGLAHGAEALPDWSGWWTNATPVSEEWLTQPPPLKPAARDRWDRRLADDGEPDPLRYCRPLQFTGYSGGFEGLLEILFTPGRVTITSEDGRLRRIYTDGRAVPPGHDVSANGASVGRWDGQTLVVVTTHIDPRASYPNSVQGSMPIGRDVRIVERIGLRDRDTLVFDIETHAPDVLTATDRRTRIYKRFDKPFPQEISFCADQDRSVDRSGRQQFDLTPPTGLPPPPPVR